MGWNYVATRFRPRTDDRSHSSMQIRVAMQGAPLPEPATLIAEKVDGAGRHVRQIELCSWHCDVVIQRERLRGLEISDRRDE
jgi:hypothetical protein